MTREEMITGMCYTWRHDYGLDKEDTDLIGSGMTKFQRVALWNQMAQVFDNTIAPHMEFKNASN